MKKDTLSYFSSIPDPRIDRCKFHSLEDIVLLGISDIHPFSNSENSKIDKYLKGVDKDMVNILDIEKIINDESIIVNNNNS